MKDYSKCQSLVKIVLKVMDPVRGVDNDGIDLYKFFFLVTSLWTSSQVSDNLIGSKVKNSI